MNAVRISRLAVPAAVLLVLSACATATAEVSPRPAAAPATAAPEARTVPADFDLSVASIMRGEQLVGRSPNQVRWSPDSRFVYFRWRDPEVADTTTHIYRVAAEGGEPEMLADTLAERVMPAAGGTWSADGARFAFVRGGNVFVAERDGRERQITDTGRPERNPHFSRQGRTVHFLSGNDVYAVDLDGGPFRQLVEIRTENEPRERDPEGQRGFLHEQQEELFGVIRDRARERERREEVEEARTRVPRIHIGQGRSLGSAEVSQSGRYLLITVSERANADQTMVPNFVTEDGYVAPLNARPKVGDAVAGQQVGIVDLESGELSWFPFGEEDEGRTVTAAGWSPTEDRALLLTISLDYKNRWIHTLTPDLESVEIEHLHDEAWVGGPGLFTAGLAPRRPRRLLRLRADRVGAPLPGPGHRRRARSPHRGRLGGARRPALARRADLPPDHQRDPPRRAAALRHAGHRGRAHPHHPWRGVQPGRRLAGREQGGGAALDPGPPG
jgi:hypothetical protein